MWPVSYRRNNIVEMQFLKNQVSHFKMTYLHVFVPPSTWVSSRCYRKFLQNGGVPAKLYSTIKAKRTLEVLSKSTYSKLDINQRLATIRRVFIEEKWLKLGKNELYWVFTCSILICFSLALQWLWKQAASKTMLAMKISNLAATRRDIGDWRSPKSNISRKLPLYLPVW